MDQVEQFKQRIVLPPEIQPMEEPEEPEEFGPSGKILEDSAILQDEHMEGNNVLLEELLNQNEQADEISETQRDNILMKMDEVVSELKTLNTSIKEEKEWEIKLILS